MDFQCLWTTSSIMWPKFTFSELPPIFIAHSNPAGLVNHTTLKMSKVLPWLCLAHAVHSAWVSFSLSQRQQLMPPFSTQACLTGLFPAHNYLYSCVPHLSSYTNICLHIPSTTGLLSSLRAQLMSWVSLFPQHLTHCCAIKEHSAFLSLLGTYRKLRLHQQEKSIITWSGNSSALTLNKHK